ncbi:MAG: DUF2288 domain-containing protein [Gammaproteobacteria bacterium]
MTDKLSELEKTRVNLETSKIPWAELQRFFAAGQVIDIDRELDLVEVAYQFSVDNKTKVEEWLKNKQLAPVSDDQALAWHQNNVDVWAVVVKPWILVQSV